MMSDIGYFITRLTLDGPEVESAVIELSDGLNVISGPSNTGKTYIAQCIDFVLGASKSPEDIVEARPYDRARVALTARSKADEYELSRSLRGGDITLTTSDGSSKSLNGKHSPSSIDTVSYFLLSLCGLAGKKVLKNQRGTTRTVSFRDIARLTLVDEESIIKRESPIHSGRPTDSTVEQSVFRLLLTGVDDSSVVESKEVKVQKAESRGKSEILDSLEGELRGRLAEMNADESADEVRTRRQRLDDALAGVSNSLDEQRANASSVEEERRSAWKALQRVEARQQVISQLRERFALLSEQYNSDLERLTSIAEVGARLGELKEECCPVCGALAEHHNVEHGEEGASPDMVAMASVAESRKVHTLLADLGKTIVDTADEAANLGTDRTSLEGTLREVTERLQRELRPNVRIALDDYKELHRERTSLDELLSLHSQLEQIASLRQAQENEKLEKSESIVTKVSVAETENFCLEIQTLFEEWQLPNADRVVFSEDAQDIVVSGRPRSSDGKGVRAITH